MTEPDDLWPGRELHDDAPRDRAFGAMIAIAIIVSAVAFWVGPDAWAANPWVAAISFTVSRGNIDGGDA